VKKGILSFILSLALALVLVLGMGLTLPTPVGADAITFTGNVPADFDPLVHPGVLIIPDPQPQDCNVTGLGIPSGWDMVDLRLLYNASTDTLYVGINTAVIAGDADNDGNPGLMTRLPSGNDPPDLGGTETINVYFDLDKSGNLTNPGFDVIAGVPVGLETKDITDFTVATWVSGGNKWSPGYYYGTNLASHNGGCYGSPNATAPDFEFTITNFKSLPGQDASVGGFIVWAMMGSQEDGGIGEDYLSYEQNPHTTATIVSSAATVASGGSVSLNVTEANPAGPYAMNITNPQVVVTKNGAPLPALGAPDSGDAAPSGVLNVGETWHWNNRASGAITVPTTFVARGSGAAPGDFPVNNVTDPLEQVDVTVNTGAPNTITTIAANATTVPINGKVSLTVTEQNTGSDNLTKPRVEVRQNGTLIATLNSTSGNFSGDNGNGILNTGETWKWINILSKAINATTTFEAKGFGTDSQGHEVSYATGYLGERAVVIVNIPPVGWETYPVNKVRVLLPWIALLAAIMVGASLLLVLRHRRAQN
jgi:hypothetical protein